MYVLAGAIMFGIFFQIFRINHICCMLQVCGKLKKIRVLFQGGLNTLKKKLISAKVIPMGNPVVYVCVGWCDHVGILFQTFESINICRTLLVEKQTFFIYYILAEKLLRPSGRIITAPIRQNNNCAHPAG